MAAVSVLPSPVAISATLPASSAIAPSSCTSYGRSPSAAPGGLAADRADLGERPRPRRPRSVSSSSSSSRSASSRSSISGSSLRSGARSTVVPGRCRNRRNLFFNRCVTPMARNGTRHRSRDGYRGHTVRTTWSSCRRRAARSSSTAGASSNGTTAETRCLRIAPPYAAQQVDRLRRQPLPVPGVRQPARAPGRSARTGPTGRCGGTPRRAGPRRRRPGRTPGR